MALEVIKNIDIDFYDKKYVLINAKQLDNKSRQLLVTCYNQGVIIPINEGEHAAYIRYEKSDGYGVFNKCKIKGVGKVLVEFTEQMLTSDGICYADLLIVNKNDAKIDSETCEIIIENDACVLSSMTFCIDVGEIPVANSEIESSYEYNAFNQSLADYWKRFEDVMKISKSWAEGDTGIREGESTNNSKYWSEQSKRSSNASSTSASKAATSESNANEYMTNALTYSQNAETYMNSAEDYKDASANSATASADSAAAAADSQEKAKTSEDAAKNSEENAKASENAASQSETNAQTYMNEASTSKTNAKTSETNALNSANRAQSYAVGGTGTRDGEDSSNAYYYYEKVKSIISGLESGFIPMGTVSFEELSTVEKLTGYVYNIRNDFVTDESFAEGSGKPYTAGVNVYFTANGLWDCFGGASSPTATVDEVRYYLGINEEIEIN
jgi:hypothetical protein